MAVGAISEARIRANKANALRSTGPISAQGKATSSSNATKHGLAGQGIAPAAGEPAEMEERLDAWRAGFDHLGPVASWLLRDLVTASVHIDSIQRVATARERRDRREARESWDTLGRIEAEELGYRLASEPGRIVLLLERTPQGCNWLIHRWRLALDQFEPFAVDADRRLRPILDLLGVPADFATPRKLDPQALLAHRTGTTADVWTWQQVGDEEIRRLTALRDQLAAGQDADRKRDAERGELLHDDANTKLIRRYEMRALRRFDRRFAQLREVLGGNEGAGAPDAENCGTSGAAVALVRSQLQCPPHIPPQRSGVRPEGAGSTEQAPPDLANAPLPSHKPTPLSASGRHPADADRETLPPSHRPRNRAPRRRFDHPGPFAAGPNEPTCHSGSEMTLDDGVLYPEFLLTDLPVSPIPAHGAREDPDRVDRPGGPRRCSATNAARKGSGSSALSAGPDS